MSAQPIVIDPNEDIPEPIWEPKAVIHINYSYATDYELSYKMEMENETK